MVNAQKKLNEVYPKTERRWVSKIDMSDRDLEDSLKLEGFINLEELRCSRNKITKLEIINCPKLKKLHCAENFLTKLDLNENEKIEELYCYDNKLTELKINNCKNLTKLSCAGNELTDVKFLDGLLTENDEKKKINEKLTHLDISDNCIFFEEVSSQSDSQQTPPINNKGLDFLSKFTNLKYLYIENTVEGKDKGGKYNNFAGSLESLTDLKKLKKLDISNTDISKGLEYLPDGLEIKNIICSSNKKIQSKKEEWKVSEIEKELKSSEDKEMTINQWVEKEWSNFFTEHDITSDKDLWQEVNLDIAKKAYTEFLALPDFPWSEKLTEEEKDKINNAKSPNDIKEIAWGQFFFVNKITDDERIAWKMNSGLTVIEAITVWNNGWQEGSKYGKDWKNLLFVVGNKVDNLQCLEHQWDEAVKVLNLLIRIDKATDLTILRGITIEEEYNENSLPKKWDYEELKKIKDKQELKLFKIEFEKSTPTGISEDDLKKWLSSDTGLAKNGTDERKVFNNGWTEPEKIKDSLIEHGFNKFTKSTISGKILTTTITKNVVKVLEVDKDQLEKALSLKSSIENLKFENLENFKTSWQADINKLDSDLLPDGLKKEDIEKLLKNKEVDFDKAQLDITEIKAELAEKPMIIASELKDLDYEAEMLGLVADDTQRTIRKSKIVAEINRVRNNKSEGVYKKIVNASTVLKKDKATKEELEKVVNDLKTLSEASADSAEQIVWAKNSTENQKLLTDLENKLSKEKEEFTNQQEVDHKLSTPSK